MRKEDMLDLYEGKRVAISTSAGVAERMIYADVRGIATTPLPILGRFVIVEPEEQIGEFSCITVAEVHLAERKS